MSQSIEQIQKQKVKDRIQEDFLSGISPLDPILQACLYILTKSGHAMGIRPLRNLMINEIAEQSKDSLFAAYNIPMAELSSVNVPVQQIQYRTMTKRDFFGREHTSEVPINEVNYTKESQDLIGRTRREEKYRNYYNGIRSGSSESANIFRSFLSDDILLRIEIAPLSYTQKIKLWEKALRKKLKYKVPSWKNIQEALVNLTARELIGHAEVQDQKSGDVYYLLPETYKAWENQRDKVKTKEAIKGYKLSDKEQIWFTF